MRYRMLVDGEPIPTGIQLEYEGSKGRWISFVWHGDSIYSSSSWCPVRMKVEEEEIVL
jgi:acyl dehydratase